MIAVIFFLLSDHIQLTNECIRPSFKKLQENINAGLPDDTNSHIKTIYMYIYIYMATKNNNCILI